MTTPLDQARLESLDRLLGVLDLDSVSATRFRAPGAPGQFPRTFGGRLVAQALVAAAATVEGKPPSSLHACFVGGGLPDDPVDIDVGVAADSRATATRDVALAQQGRPLLTMIASFHDDTDTAWLPPAVLDGPGPDETPLLQDWVKGATGIVGEQASTWIDRPPPVDIRIAEPPVFLGGPQPGGPRSHWMRLPRPVGDDPVRQAALLAHASDYLLLDAAFRSHPEAFGSGRLSGTSLDHAVWFHRTVRFERWHRHTYETVALGGERGLVRGTIHDEDGNRVASTAQAVLVRVSEPTG